MKRGQPQTSHLFAEQQVTFAFMTACSSSYLWRPSSAWVILEAILPIHYHKSSLMAELFMFYNKGGSDHNYGAQQKFVVE